ncbi:hypothetical protein [Actinomadura harenae]|uniref:Uncharacterized protein n=1 Tax=Actinomadura harenae TaxID=2483351 RepID=A0A3M2LHR2_9ACTN|nr:hypothetical protein [Actinomadura harenae]RMI36340.1 hypothetical protein EBO15_38905 [Actinomadura harenae]
MSENPPPQQKPPPYAAPAPAYTRVTDEQREIWETKGRRGVGFGAAWLIGGLLLSLITYSNAASHGGVYIVAWGPVLYGIYRIVTGARLIQRARS